MSNVDIVNALLDELLEREQLPGYKQFLDAHEDVYDLLPQLSHGALVDVWQSSFLMVLPAGLGIAEAKHRDKIVVWTDGMQPALAQAHRENEEKLWTVSELAHRAGISTFAARVGLLYWSRFLPGCVGPVVDAKTGFPEATQFSRDIRRPSTSLLRKISNASITSKPKSEGAYQEPSRKVHDLRARLSNGEMPDFSSFAVAPLPKLLHEVADDALIDSTDILLLTAAEEERNAILRRLAPPRGREAVVQAHLGKQTFYFGLLGGVPIALTRCRAGSVRRDGAILTVDQAIQHVHPRAVVAVGFAFGGYTKDLRIGDVLVSTAIESYDVVRKQPGGSIVRSPRPEAGPLLLNRFREAVCWEFKRADEYVCQVREGLVISGEELVDDLDRKVELFEQHPEAIGGEMESSGVYGAAASNWLTEWIVVKAVCDWADGRKNKVYQPLAAAAAVSLVEHVFSKPGALTGLPTIRVATDQEREIAPSAPDRRSRDLRWLTRALPMIGPRKLDYYFELALSGQILNETFLLWESFNAEIAASDFYLFDRDLDERVRGFWGAWHKSLSFGEHFYARDFNPPTYRLEPSFAHHEIEKRQAVVDAFDNAVGEAMRTYRLLIEHVKRSYPEIDFEDVNKRCHALLRELSGDARADHGVQGAKTDEQGRKGRAADRGQPSNKAPPPRGKRAQPVRDANTKAKVKPKRAGRPAARVSKGTASVTKSRGKARKG